LKISPQYFRIHFVRNFAEHAARLGEIHFRRKTNQLTSAATKTDVLSLRNNDNLPVKSNQLRCCMWAEFMNKL